MKDFTAYDIFIRRPAALDHRDRMPTDEDVQDVVNYINLCGYNTSAEKIRSWLAEEHVSYIASTLTWNA